MPQSMDEGRGRGAMSAARARLRRHWSRMAAKVATELKPGDPRYLGLAPYMVPIEVNLGHDKISGDPVQWLPGDESNGFFLVLGSSGSGKTEALKAIGHGIADMAFPVLVLDFHGDFEFPGLNTVLLSSAANSYAGINPMELEWEGDELVGFYDQLVSLVDMIVRAAPRLSPKQVSVLMDAFREAYRQAGYSEDHPQTWRYPAPTFSDVLRIIEDWIRDPRKKELRQSLPGCRDAIRREFNHPIFSRRSMISTDQLLTGNIRVKLNQMADSVRYIAAETILRKVYRALRQKGHLPSNAQDDTQRFRLFVLIDEAKILSTGRNDVDAPDHILNILLTEGRKYGVGAVLASQTSDHFGGDVKSSASAWLIMKPMDVEEAKRNAPNAFVTQQALRDLHGKGDGYYRCRQFPGSRLIQVQQIAVAKKASD